MPYINWNAYVLNHIKLNLAQKNFQFLIINNSKTFKIVGILKTFGIILNYKLINSNNNKNNYIKVYIYYYKSLNFSKTFKLLFFRSKSFFITLPMLKLLNKRIGDSVYILIYKQKYITHIEALNKKIGGQLVYFIS